MANNYPAVPKSVLLKKILDFASTQKMTGAQKEKLMELVIKELGQIGDFEQEIELKLSQLTNHISNSIVGQETSQINVNPSSMVSDGSNPVKINQVKGSTTDNEIFIRQMPIVHMAYKLPKLLGNFTSSAFKYATHTWDTGSNSSYDDFMEKITKEWHGNKNTEGFGQKLKDINNRLHAKVNSFLFRKDLGKSKKDNPNFKHSWGEHQLKVGWSSQFIKEYLDRGNTNPLACAIPSEIRSLEKLDLPYFEDYVNIFKNEIEIREDNQGLRKLLDKLWETSLTYDFNLSQIGTDGKSFFTDVQWLRKVLSIIFEMCRKRPEFNEIRVTASNILDAPDKHLVLDITQIGSNSAREVNHPKLNGNQGDLKEIISGLENIADFSIISKFNGEYKKVNYLTSVPTCDHIESYSKVDGFTFQLKFYL